MSTNNLSVPEITEMNNSLWKAWYESIPSDVWETLPGGKYRIKVGWSLPAPPTLKLESDFCQSDGKTCVPTRNFAVPSVPLTDEEIYESLE